MLIMSEPKRHGRYCLGLHIPDHLCCRLLVDLGAPSAASFAPGIYNIRITAANVIMLVNGVTTAMRAVPGGQQAVFWAKAPGAYSFDFIVANPSGAVDILMQSPDKGEYSCSRSMDGFSHTRVAGCVGMLWLCQ